MNNLFRFQQQNWKNQHRKRTSGNSDLGHKKEEDEGGRDLRKEHHGLYRQGGGHHRAGDFHGGHSQ
jgi:hypothetical protein